MKFLPSAPQLKARAYSLAVKDPVHKRVPLVGGMLSAATRVAGVAVDSADDVWIIQRPHPLPAMKRLPPSPPRAKCCVPAPPMIEFDRNGQSRALVGRARRLL